MSRARTEIDTQLKTWGNSYGVVIPKRLADTLGLLPGMDIHVTIEHEADKNNAAQLQTWDFPYRPTREVLDEED